jgi:hypothetical protein
LSEEFHWWHDKQFETLWHFQVFPPPSCANKLKKLGAHKPKGRFYPQIGNDETQPALDSQIESGDTCGRAPYIKTFSPFSS